MREQKKNPIVLAYETYTACHLRIFDGPSIAWSKIDLFGSIKSLASTMKMKNAKISKFSNGLASNYPNRTQNCLSKNSIKFEFFILIILKTNNR